MNYISTPLALEENTGHGLTFCRDIEDRVKMIDNMVDLIVFTPRGSFHADPDFGFEYWNHEYSNVQSREFNNGHGGMTYNGLYDEVTRQECEDSVRNSLSEYLPFLHDVNVRLTVNPIEETYVSGRRVNSKYVVILVVKGMFNDGIKNDHPYRKDVQFLMEPTVKKYR